MSTRQLPAGDASTEKKSLHTFKESVTAEFKEDRDFLERIERSSESIARFVSSKMKSTESEAHISVGAGGSYSLTVAEGGRSMEVYLEALPILEHVPLADEEIKTPWGVFTTPAGIARWRSWGRSKIYNHWIQGQPKFGIFDPSEYIGQSPETAPHMYFDKSYGFGEILPVTYLGEADLVKQGYDYALGMQLTVAAFIAMQKHEGTIPARVLTVPEPGLKARIVTTTTWWNNLLQQSVSHRLIRLLREHPFSEAGLTRSNQAWNFQYLAAGKELPKGSELLVSDLKEATDHIPHSVGLALLRGFARGLSETIPGFEIAARLSCSDRIFHTPIGIILSSGRGIMMGEPMAKPTLTLHQLVMEDLAFHDLHNIPDYEVVSPVDKTRCFAVGGDDVIGMGPRPYLEGISNNLTLAGAKLSPEKHGIKPVVARYCEKLIEVSKMLRCTSVSVIYRDYLNSPWIESVKVRLLSPTTKSTEIQNERNTAIGKGLMLGKELRYFPPTVFSAEHKSLIRDRFILRMGSLLPDRSKGTFWHLLLPTWFGGLDLWMPEDLALLPTKLPGPSKALLKYYGTTSMPKGMLEQFSRLTSNSFFRGVDVVTVKDRIATVCDNLEEAATEGKFLTMLEKRTYRDLRSEIKGQLPESVVARQLTGKGWLTREEIIDYLSRPAAFTLSLEGGREKRFNTIPLKERYGKLWLRWDLSEDITEAEVKEALLRRPPDLWLYNVKTTGNMSFFEGQIVQVPLLEEPTLVMPSLKLYPRLPTVLA